MAGPMATGDVEEAVGRPHWEARHEWESRVKFVEDNVATHGLEKSINLSFVWSNMKFLGCSYPSATEALVAHYPLPDMDELRARRRCKQSLKDKARKRSGSETNEVDAGPPSPKQSKFDLSSVSDVSAFISSIRSQSEQEPPGSSSSVPKVIQDIANSLCLCDKCLGRTPDASQKGQRILERYQRDQKSFSFDFTFDEIPKWQTPTGSQTIGHRCSLNLNGSTVLERVTSKKKESKAATAAAFTHMVEEWQDNHKQPSCPNMAPPPPPNMGRGSFHPPGGGGHGYNYGMRGGGYPRPSGPPRPREGGRRYY